MRSNLLIVAGVLGVLGLGVYVGAATLNTSEAESARFSRACIMPAGGWTKVDCSAAAAYSAELTENTRYIIQCTSDAYIATDDAASGADADSNDGYLPSGEWLELLTTDTIKYYSCDASAGGGDCRHFECQ